MSKISKTEARYQGHPNGHERCGICSMFVPKHECTAVEGDIYNHGWCKLWALKHHQAFAFGGAVADMAEALEKAARQTEKKPSDGQKEAGNYAKGKFRWHGETIAIENRKGSIRSGVGKDGKKWSVKMPAPYGYLLGTKAVDGDHVDCYIGPAHASKKVWVIDQVDSHTKEYDEPKCMLSFPSRVAALDTYRKAFSDGKADDRIGHVTEMSIPRFKSWANSSAAKKPLRG